MEPTRRVTRNQDRDPNYYLLLNDGYEDDNVPTQSEIESQENVSFSSQSIPSSTPTPMLSPRNESPSIPPLSSSPPNFMFLPQYQDRFRASLPSTRKKKPESWVWEYFVVDEEFDSAPWELKNNKKIRIMTRDQKVKCKLDYKGEPCPVSWYKSGLHGATSNLSTHLKNYHGIVPAGAMLPPAQTTLDKTWSRKDMVTEQENTECFLAFIIDCQLPFTFIESKGFLRFMELHGVQLPFKSRITLQRALKAKFTTERIKLKQELLETCQTISLSLDCWTSPNDIPILGVIGHWITEDFYYREVILECIEVEGSHTSENLAGLVFQLLEEFDISSKLLAITCDNASNNDGMVIELYHQLTSLQRNHRFTLENGQIRCMAHVLNLIVKAITKALKAGTRKQAHERLEQYKERARPQREEDRDELGGSSALANLRIIVMFIHRTPERKTKWKRICLTYFPKLPGKLITTDVETRWNSTFYMLQDALKAREALTYFIFHETSFKLLTSTEWNELTWLEMVLTRFEAYTTFVEHVNPRIPYVVFIYYELNDLLASVSEKSEDFEGLPNHIAEAVKIGIEKYNKYYQLMDGNLSYYLGMVLHPAIKIGLLRDDLSAEALKVITDNVATFINTEYGERSRKESSPDHLTPLISSSLSSASESLERRRPVFRGPRLNLNRLKNAGQFVRPQQPDIERYLAIPAVEGDQEDLIDNPKWALDWWRVNAQQFPRVAEAARDYLAIPCSEVSVERLFSTGRDTIGIRRHRLSGETLRILMYLKARTQGT